MREKKLSEINDVCEALNNYYPGTTTLTENEFNDVFSDYFADYSEVIFNILKTHSYIDVYELLASIVIFSSMPVDDKYQFVFSLFDFDGSGEIERKELTLTS